LNDLDKKTCVGIITFHRAINYGALLQVYALQTSVEKLGCNCEVIDYHSNCIDRHYNKLVLSKCKGFKNLAKFFLYARAQNSKYDKFHSFSNRYLHLSSVCKNHNDLSLISSCYDFLISGSDQVWNHNLTDFDAAYFLSFEEDSRKKKAYGASFGILDIPEEKIDDYRRFLKGYSYITVREKQGEKIVKNLTGNAVGVVLDPTLLLGKDEWNQIAAEIRERDYILIYSFGLSMTMKRFVEGLSKRTGFRVIFLPAYYSVRDRIDASYVKNAGPEEYLAFFKNARYVVTNSFHGIVFSLKYNKQFFIEKLEGTLKERNTRFDSLLDLLDLHDREIINGENCNIDEPINYTRVNGILEQERMKSMAYLERLVSVPK
jgi:hypothetical protein